MCVRVCVRACVCVHVVRVCGVCVCMWRVCGMSMCVSGVRVVNAYMFHILPLMTND